MREYKNEADVFFSIPEFEKTRKAIAKKIYDQQNPPTYVEGVECKYCHMKTAFMGFVQKRSSDEAPDVEFECKNGRCGRRWNKKAG